MTTKGLVNTEINQRTSREFRERRFSEYLKKKNSKIKRAGRFRHGWRGEGDLNHFVLI
jgi:hypothetical protein